MMVPVVSIQDNFGKVNHAATSTCTVLPHWQAIQRSGNMPSKPITLYKHMTNCGCVVH